jgi:hypothetical protein
MASDAVQQAAQQQSKVGVLTYSAVRCRDLEMLCCSCLGVARTRKVLRGLPCPRVARPNEKTPTVHVGVSRLTTASIGWAPSLMEASPLPGPR